MDSFWDDSRCGIFKITDRIYQGPAPRVPWEHFLSRGITHILNVSEQRNVGIPDAIIEQFRPVNDLRILPTQYVLDALKYMRDVLAVPSQTLFVHCAAGQNRSPTMVWLFLVASGIEPGVAKRCIESNTLDAIAGHPALLNDQLLADVVAFGRAACTGIPIQLYSYPA